MHLQLWSLLLSLLAMQFSGAMCQQLTETQQQQQQHRMPTVRTQQAPQGFQVHPSRSNNNSGGYRHNRGSPNAIGTCDYKELLTSLHDRVSVLASLDEDLRTRLDRIDKKMVQFEASNLARLDSLAIQQTDLLKRLDAMEHIERMTKRDIAELKGDLNDDKKDKEHTISSRQADRLPPVDETMKLDSLAILLESIGLAVADLRKSLADNVTTLSNTLEKRLNIIQRQNQRNRQPQQTFYSTNNPTQPLITSCANGAPTANGILQVQLTPTSEPFYVRCDENTLGGGWTIVQNRFNGKLNFYRGWLDYKKGFGNLGGEFFIGLEKLHALTASAVHELLILMQDFNGQSRYAHYNLFAIGSEDEQYALNLLGDYSGDAGDSLSYHAGYKFSTFDNDNDGCVDCNCASSHNGAWWYNWCDMSNLNGKYHSENYNNTDLYLGMYWEGFRGPQYSLKAVRMMIRPVTTESEQQ